MFVIATNICNRYCHYHPIADVGTFIHSINLKKAL